jgi:hypothetical protein
MPASSPDERKRIASIAGLTGWANTIDRSARGRNGHNGLVAKFERQAREANPTLSDPEIHRRANTLYKLHMQRITQAAVRARRRRHAEREKKGAAMKAAREAKALQASGAGGAA